MLHLSYRPLRHPCGNSNGPLVISGTPAGYDQGGRSLVAGLTWHVRALVWSLAAPLGTRDRAHVPGVIGVQGRQHAGGPIGHQARLMTLDSVRRIGGREDVDPRRTCVTRTSRAI